MSKVLFIIPEDKFRDEELFEPQAVLQASGHTVTIASTIRGNVTGDLGGQATSELTLSEIAAESFDALGVIGGSGTSLHLWNQPLLLQLIHAFAAKGKLVSAICAGSATLAQSGLLKGLRATTYPVAELTAELTNHGAQFVSDHVVIDGGIITAGGPEGASAYGHALVHELSKPKRI